MAKLLIEEEELAPKIRLALDGWKNLNSVSGEFIDNLLLVRQRREELPNHANYIAAMRLATNEVLYEGLDALADQDDVAAKILRGRFIDDEKLRAIGHQLNMSEFSVSRRQKEAIGVLTQIIWQRELAARRNWVEKLLDALPSSTYSKLFGVQAAQTKLVAQLLSDEAPPIVAIEGMGGIGKTALADSVVREVARHYHYDRIIWIYVERPKTLSGRSYSADHAFSTLLNGLARKLWEQPPSALLPDKLATQIRQKLKEIPYLVIIDNLESVSDLSYLLSRLPEFVGPSRFLLTTRAHPASIQTAVYRHSLSELPKQDSIELVLHYANSIGLTELEEVDVSHLEAIYQITGGNPLALRLVVGLLDTLPLTHILTGFLNNQISEVGDIYGRIYQQAWQTLSSNARALLQVMTLVSESGAPVPYLLQLSMLSEENFWPAFNELRGRSLIEIRGSILEKRYGIHRLTDSFLRNQVIFWSDEEEA